MRHVTVLVRLILTSTCLVAACLLMPAMVSAQGFGDPYGPAFFGGSASERGACRELVETEPSWNETLSNGKNEPTPAELHRCFDLIERRLSDGATAAPEGVRGASAADRLAANASDVELLQTWRALELLWPWVSHLSYILDSPARSELNEAYDALERRARTTLQQERLLGGSMAAALSGGLTLADPGGQAGSTPGAATHGIKTVHLGFETEMRPLSMPLGLTAALGLRVARQPVLAFVRNPAVSASTPSAEPVYRNGIAMNGELRFAHAFRSAELASASRAGAVRVGLDPVTITTRGTNNITTTKNYAAADNDIDEWALFFDTRLDLRWYDRPVWVKRLNMETLDPLLRASVGLRHDERFHRKGDLQPFNDPTGRIFFSVGLHPLRYEAFSAGGGFEFETALRGKNRLPSGYRIVLDAALDLRRAQR